MTFIFPRGYLSGLTLSTAGSSSTFGVTAGQASDSTNAAILNFASALAKTTGTWVVGTGNGALDTGSIATSTWYHAYLIQRPDTGVVDVLISLSVSAPTLPANYTLFRRIGSMKTDGSAHWIKFVQLGDEFLWDVYINDVNAATGTTAIVARTLTVPTGFQVSALVSIGSALGASGDGRFFVFSPDVNSAGAIANGSSVSNLIVGSLVFSAPSSVQSFYPMSVRTNAAAQIKTSAVMADSSMYINTTGWVDHRGKDQ